MRCDICDHSTDGTTSLTHHKKIHYTPEKPFDCTKCGKGSRNKFHFHQHNLTPSKNKVKAFQWFICEKYVQKNKILGSIMIISIKTSKGSLINNVVKSLGKSAWSAWRCDICKVPYPHSRALKGHIKWVNKTKPIIFFILCEIMYKTNSEK